MSISVYQALKDTALLPREHHSCSHGLLTSPSSSTDDKMAAHKREVIHSSSLGWEVGARAPFITFSTPTTCPRCVIKNVHLWWKEKTRAWRDGDLGSNLLSTTSHETQGCWGPASAGSRGYPQDERRRREREKTHETSLDRAKSVFYFLTARVIPFHRTFSRHKILTHDYTGLALHHFDF